MNSPIVLDSDSPERTRQIGFCLGESLQSGDLVALVGPLGAGKTTFAQGLLKGLGVQGYVTSPSFTIANEYRGRAKVVHLDLYRIDRAEELWEVGLEEYLSGDYVIVVEWAEKIEPHLSGEYLRIGFERINSTRRLSFEPRGGRFSRIVMELDSKCS